MLIALDNGGEKGYNRGMENTMNAKFYKTKRFFKSGSPYFLACGLVLGVYLFMLILRKVYPFGPYTVASYDLSAQICPFIEHIFDVWKGRSTPLFSYAIGGGADMFGSLAYFIFSPFSPLFLIFGEGMVAEAAGVVIGCKLLTLAAIGVWFARTQFGLSPLVSACLGVLYAYCGYTFVSNTYINWMDLLMYTPFAVWAFKKMLKTGNFWLFSAFVAACVYTSFSIACFSMFTVYPVLVQGIGIEHHRHLAVVNEGKQCRLALLALPKSWANAHSTVALCINGIAETILVAVDSCHCLGHCNLYYRVVARWYVHREQPHPTAQCRTRGKHRCASHSL